MVKEKIKQKLTSVRLPEEMYERLNRQAKESFRSVSSEIIYRLQLLEQMEEKGALRMEFEQ